MNRREAIKTAKEILNQSDNLTTELREVLNRLIQQESFKNSNRKKILNIEKMY